MATRISALLLTPTENSSKYPPFHHQVKTRKSAITRETQIPPSQTSHQMFRSRRLPASMEGRAYSSRFLEVSRADFSISQFHQSTDYVTNVVATIFFAHRRETRSCVKQTKMKNGIAEVLEYFLYNTICGIPCFRFTTKVVFLMLSDS